MYTQYIFHDCGRLITSNRVAPHNFNQFEKKKKKNIWWHHIFIKAYRPFLYIWTLLCCSFKNRCSVAHFFHHTYICRDNSIFIPARSIVSPHFHDIVSFCVHVSAYLLILRQISRIRFIFWCRFAFYFHLRHSLHYTNFVYNVIFTHSTHSSDLSLALFLFLSFIRFIINISVSCCFEVGEHSSPENS